MERVTDLLYPKKIKFFGVGAQIATVAVLFAGYVFYSYLEYHRTGSMFGYPLSISILFVPIYEELIFRGVILGGLTRFYSDNKAIVISSLLFGLWHLKNIFFMSTPALIEQIFYTALIFGPITAYITLKTKNVWLAVILHYLNNILVPLSAGILILFRK